MKPVKKSELKVGDWISTSQIYNTIRYATTTIKQVCGYKEVAKVIKIDNNKITIKCWVGEEIKGVIKEEEIFLRNDNNLVLLDKDERIEIIKKLILKGLENETK